MNLQETIIQLNELKLRGMSSSFEAMTSLPVQNRPSLEVAISKMVDAEVQDRRDRKTVIIASQLPIAKWYDYMGDPTLADAIMDRLVANASKIELKGDPMRQKLKK